MSKETIKFPSIKDVPASAWEKLAQKKIYFGHQSVGNNIMDGVNDIMKENPQIKIKIVKTSSPSEFSGPIFAHETNLGKNNDPISKIDAFVSFIEKGIGDVADTAFLKFCFVDVDAGTDVQKLFADYKSTMTKLIQKYPKTTFVHFTIPLLKKEKSSFKTWIKKLIGKQDGFFNNKHNVARNKFNELLINEYTTKEPVFDIALIESTYPDGKRETFTNDGKSYFSLVPEYTGDGGHLNELGRKKAAEQLLILLANLK